MANLKDIKNRIQSVQSTKKITRAMKMVAAAKVKRAENSVKVSRPFTSELNLMFAKLLGSVGKVSETNINIKSAIDNYPCLLKTRQLKQYHSCHFAVGFDLCFQVIKCGKTLFLAQVCYEV